MEKVGGEELSISEGDSGLSEPLFANILYIHVLGRMGGFLRFKASKSLL